RFPIWEGIKMPNIDQLAEGYNWPVSTYERIGREVGKLVAEKNAAYGDSFAKSGDFLRLLYPDGIKPEQYRDALCIVRIFDKLMRIATAKDAFGESPYRDIVGYGILGVAMDANKAESRR
ncbi:hypothetical protein ABEV74_18990, partial [Paenibacillus cisolokensis]|uniref:hypothetical protein n=1 Tax=Paenibacillus cisolokensis TaxID=1658519 RepID=UPI003D28504A